MTRETMKIVVVGASWFIFVGVNMLNEGDIGRAGLRLITALPLVWMALKWAVPD